MKKTIRILIPLFLVLTILLCTVWYLFVYDRAFTKDMLLGLARYSESKGNHTMATWLYNHAYSQSGDSDAVAIELANQYKSIGNYTKAENTLANAIADGGSVALYVELCRTYVEQDKLLDAVNMLDGITNEEIKAQIDAMRPDMPHPPEDMPPETYNAYISVPLLTNKGTIYYSTDTQYPTTANDPYAEAIALAEGETMIRAVAVNDGLVSKLNTMIYTVGGVVEEVVFTDAKMEAAIREALGVDAVTTLMTNELWQIKTFTVPADAADYSDLNYLRYLESLTIENGVAEQLNHIVKLKGTLKELVIRDTTVSSELLESISTFEDLTKLTLHHCGLTSISALSICTNLTDLDLSANSIRNIDVISGMQALENLNLKETAVIDLTALSTLQALKQLDVSDNGLTSIAPLCNAANLTILEASNNSISILGSIDKLTKLTYLHLGENNITDVSKLASCVALEDLDISRNFITDISGLSALTKLMYFDFSHNQVIELPQWPADCALVTINGSNNLISSVAPLSGLQQLNNVLMDYNTEITDIDILADCPMLIRVDVFGTKVSNFELLREQRVIVNFSTIATPDDEGDEDTGETEETQ